MCKYCIIALTSSALKIVGRTYKPIIGGDYALTVRFEGNDEEKIFQNEEIKLLLSAMNITPGRYDAKKLRYGKLAICTDADSDGYHIGLLIMAALTYLAPDFIKEGRLCWLRSPLYIVENGKTESAETKEVIKEVIKEVPTEMTLKIKDIEINKGRIRKG